MLEQLDVETGAAPDATVIWLHGLGADGHDFEPIVPELGLQDRSIRFVFPHAPVRAVTINGGMQMRAWYDIKDSAIRREDESGVRESQAQIEALIARERSRGVPASRMVLAGFSQGGAIALQTALRHPERLAGVLALSTYLPLADKLGTESSPANRDVPIFMAHGTEDPVIPISRAQTSRRELLDLGYPVEWSTSRPGFVPRLRRNAEPTPSPVYSPASLIISRKRTSS